MSNLPRTIDIRDDLRRAREASDADVGDDVAEITDRLDRFADPDHQDPEGLLEDVENTLLRLEEQESSDDAARRFEAARNRVGQFRTAVVDASGDLVVVHTEVKPRGGEPESAETGLEYLRGELADVVVSVANIGEAVAGQVEVALYDADGDAVDVVTTGVDLDAGEERTVTLDVEISDEAADYGVTAGAAEPSPSQPR